MGGTRSVAISRPSNGIALCGSGTTGCHGWTEANPDFARLLGWRVDRGTDPLEVPWWTTNGWRLWGADMTVSWLEFDVPDVAVALDSLARFERGLSA